MRSFTYFTVILFLCSFSSINGKGFDRFGNTEDNKLRLCFVEARGRYKKADKFCPTLKQQTKIECVIGTDPLDCLRRINKGTAHFGVFSSEDLLAAEWAGVDVLVTSEMRFNDEPFEYEIVAVVANDAGINSVNDLRDSRFCHPGRGLKSHWSEILGNYLESTMVARGCEDELSVAESRIKASANFFGPSCKPGPWVADTVEDAILKRKYPKLCQMCDNPMSCSKSDKHWGRVGPLYCLTSGEGEVAWARLDDVRSHFGFEGLKAESDPNLYSYLCPDGHLQPMNTVKPCIWVAQPWSAVAAKRDRAVEVQNLVEKLSHYDTDGWENALLNLMETYHVNITTLDTTITINDYLEQAVGFTSAYSFPSCNPPRDIVFCTASLIEHFRCSWLQEASAVRGIEPNIQCMRALSMNECMENVKHRVADAVLIDQRDRIEAERSHYLQPLLYEHAKNLSDRYTVVAVVRYDSNIYGFSDLKGKRACFPSFEGAAYLSAMETIRETHHRNDPTRHVTSDMLNEYFADDSCTWEKTYDDSKNCAKMYLGDEGALRCLIENRGDVAFIDMRIFQKFVKTSLSNDIDWIKGIDPKAYKLICPFGKGKTEDYCYMHWTNRGILMVNNQTHGMRRTEIYSSFRDMDRLFGKRYESHIIPFTMYGEFDKKSNILFHDQTEILRDIDELKMDRMKRSLEDVFTNYTIRAYFDAFISASASETQYKCNIITIIFHCTISFLIIRLMMSF